MTRGPGWIDCDGQVDVGALSGVDAEIRAVLPRLRASHPVHDGLQAGVINRFFPSLEDHRPEAGGPMLSDWKTVTLKEPGTYLTNHLDGPAVLTEVAAAFPTLMAWIDTLPFEQYGRVFLIFDDESSHEPIHRGPVPYQEFLWVRTNGDKRFFIHDETTGTDHDITSFVAWFDQARFHGAATPPPGALHWSLRVDGVFTLAFRAWLHARLPPLDDRRRALVRLFERGEDLSPAMPELARLREDRPELNPGG